MNLACAFCGSPSLRAGPERGALVYRICAQCGSGTLVEGAVSFREYYGEYDSELVLDLPPILSARYAAMLDRLERRTEGRRLLEIGCGNGYFLDVARSRGWEVGGIELSRAHVERARSRGLEVVLGDLAEDHLFSGERFDVVVAIEVVEHVPDPVGLLQAVADRAVLGGLFYATTPNFSSVTRRLLGSRWSVLSAEHVALASPRGLLRAVNASGMDVELLRSRNLYVGEYARLLRGGGKDSGPDRPFAAENAELRDRIEASRLLLALKGIVNQVLGATNLGESLECIARVRPKGA